MSKPNNEAKGSISRKLDRRAVIGGALAVGGLSALGMAMPQADAATTPRAAVAEMARREFAVVFAAGSRRRARARCEREAHHYEKLHRCASR